ncbi:hypothetical protein B0J17DRAFT_721875 [Rhizoctonia solani]|nr:hypothetical protein B0J17DRAFT_721875 [Rhizoctonia solani]
MELRLRTFVYQHVGGFERRSRPREVDLPLLDGMLVTVYQLFTVGYTSLLDSRLGLDVARVTDSWQNQGPRYDYSIVGNRRELFVTQLLGVFQLTVRGEKYSIAYVRHFKINGRSKATGYIELTDLYSQEFILTEWILRLCVVISPSIQESTHVLWDLEGSDMYLRLQNL